METFIFILKGFTAILLSLSTLLLGLFIVRTIVRHWRICKINSTLETLNGIVYDKKLPLNESLIIRKSGIKYWFDFKEGILNHISIYMSDKSWAAMHPDRNGKWRIACYNKEGNYVDVELFQSLYQDAIMSKKALVDLLVRVFPNLKGLCEITYK